MVKKISGIIGLILLSIVMYIFMKVQVTIDSPNTDKPIIKEEEVNEVSEWITIPTYDGANEVTHPKILYFKDGFNGYKYWMVATPYENNDTYLENPSVVVSNDGTNFIEPKGIKNPISGYPSIKKNDTYYSDPFILYYKDHFELFYRKTGSIENGKYISNGYNYLYHMESINGIKWFSKKIILRNDSYERYMSPSVIKTRNLYKIWYTNYDCNMKYIESNDLKKFNKPLDVKIKNFDKGVWHSEIQYKGGKYYLIFMTRNNYLYYTESKNGINFDEPKLINTNLDELKGTYNYIYKTTFILRGNGIELYIPYKVNGRWKMYHKVMTLDNFYKELNN